MGVQRRPGILGDKTLLKRARRAASHREAVATPVKAATVGNEVGRALDALLRGERSRVVSVCR